MGRVSGIYGVRGWVRIYSYTQPRENILNYSPWLIRLPVGQAPTLECHGQHGGECEGAGETGWRQVAVLAGRRQGSGVIAHLEGCDDRETARRLMGAEIAVERSQLPACDAGEFYWVDLIGLRVENLQGDDLGRVTGLLETGAHDVLVVHNGRERLIPYVRGRIVVAIEPQAGRIRVDWDESF